MTTDIDKSTPGYQDYLWFVKESKKKNVPVVDSVAAGFIERVAIKIANGVCEGGAQGLQKTRVDSFNGY